MQPTVLRWRAAIRAYGESAVARHVAAGRWIRRGQVLICHNGPLTRTEELHVALLAVKPGRAAVDRLSALAVFGATEHPSRPQVALQIGTLRPSITDAEYRWVKDLPRKITRRDWLPVLAAAHALLRATADSPDARAARTLVCRALQRKVVSALALRDALGPTPRWRYSALVRETVEDFEGGIQSVPEKEFDELVTRAGLPRPSRQQPVRGKDGRYYLDAEWAQHNLGSEVHGWQHWEFAHRESDNWRTADIVAEGRRLISFSSWAIRHEPDRVAAVLRRALISGGWRP